MHRFPRYLLPLSLIFLPLQPAFAAQHEPVPIIISTDVANGLIDTHGAQGALPVDYKPDAMFMSDGDFTPQDIDDGFTLAMAINLQAAGKVDIRAIVPIFGNAPLPSEMMVAKLIVRDLKQQPDLKMAPGAMAQASQTLQPASQWYDQTTVPVVEAFIAACVNQGVLLMRDALMASDAPVTILALGPLTDVACLLTNFPDVAPNIAEIVALASQIAGESLLLNGHAVNDFNFRMDPVAGAILMQASPKVAIRLITFALSGQTSQCETDKPDTCARHMPFNADTLKGPTPPTPASDKSPKWFIDSAGPRNAFWAKIFGALQGPFDQYTLAAALNPGLFKCAEARAYVVQCPYPAWSRDFPGGDALPYNGANNPCVDHNPKAGSQIQVTAQLAVSPGTQDNGPLVRGKTGIAGNIPQFAGSYARPVLACTDFASDAAFQQFKALVYDNTW